MIGIIAIVKMKNKFKNQNKGCKSEQYNKIKNKK